MLTESTPGRARRAARSVLLAASCCALTGCYLLQAAAGQWRVMHARVPIAGVIADPATPAQLRTRLLEVAAARDFAVRELALPDNRSYRSYADVHRAFVVWNVVATPEFSLSPMRWCFPVAGCVAYRGYFHERQARDFALALEARGLDVVVEGVPAYSTLGRFADPVLSTMLRYDDDELVATVFHELAHQLVYVRNDSEFNEAFATTVEDAGLERWLAFRGAAQRIARFRKEQGDEARLLALLTAARTQLARLYGSGAPAAQMRAGKRRLLGQLADDIGALERSAGLHYSVYDRWIAAGLNNAQLAAVATYYECLPGFERMLAAAGGDLPRFYESVRALAREPRSERHAQLCTRTTPAAPAPAG